MDEEIIEIEEVPSYDKLRYILNNEGYVYNVSFGGLIVCEFGECTEYNGEIPDGYATLEEWHDKQVEERKLNAWKVVDGNFVFDENKCNELQLLYETQEEENALATHDWVRKQAGKESAIIIDEFSTKVSDNKVAVLENSGSYDIPEIVVSGEEASGDVNVIVSNKNILGNDALTTTINGVTFTINSDGSITLDGTSTSAIEFDLKGNSTSTDMIFSIKENMDYVKSGLTENVSLSLYSFDGTDRTLVSDGGNEIINLTESAIITQAALNIPSGIKFNKVTIYPQIEIGSEASEYIKHQENSFSGTLEDGTLVIDNELDSYDPTSVVMNDKELDVRATYFTGKQTQRVETSIEALEESVELSVTEINETLSSVQDAIETVQSTMLTQTAEQFEMLFTQTGIEQTINEVQDLLDAQTTDMNTLTQYIQFKGASIELGRSDSLAKLVISNDRISFMNGDNESAYITGNQLYITDSTILRKLQVGNWIEQEDDIGNLNLRWAGEK